MIPCAYCERTLVCEGCRADYRPPDRERYEALSRPEVPVECQECGAVLVCHWCKTPYDGGGEDDDGCDGDAPAA